MRSESESDPIGLRISAFSRIGCDIFVSDWIGLILLTSDRIGFGLITWTKLRLQRGQSDPTHTSTSHTGLYFFEYIFYSTDIYTCLVHVVLQQFVGSAIHISKHFSTHTRSLRTLHSNTINTIQLNSTDHTTTIHLYLY